MRFLQFAALAVVLAGCSVGVSENDAQRVKEEFSNENYEKAMRESGKGAELEAQKQREAEYLRAGGQSDQDADQH